MNLVSIIIPVYNESKRIIRCFESITEQDYTSIEVIVVDDGSTDGTYEISTEFGKRDNRFKTIRNARKGVSSARNMGIHFARGEWIVFIDADDYVSDTFVSSLVALVEDNECDCACVSYTSDDTCLAENIALFKTIICEGDNKNKLLTERIQGAKGYVWNKIYKTRILKENNCRFDESISVGEDLLFNYQYFCYCQSIAYSKAPLYFYSQTINSSVNRLNDSEWYDLITVYIRILEKYEYKPCDAGIKYRFALMILESIYRLNYCKDPKYSIQDLEGLRMKYCKLSFAYTPSQNVKIMFFRLFPRYSMRIKRRKMGE